MRRLKDNLFMILAVFLMAGVLGACGEDPAPGENPPERQNTNPPPEAGSLLHTDSTNCSASQTNCAIPESIGVEVDLQARVLDSNDQPVQDVVVNYEIVSGDAVSFMDTKTGLTKEGGVSTVTVRTAESAGEATVRAYTNDEALGEVTWDITVTPKGGTGYQVNVTYKGEAEINDAAVKLFPGSKSCDELISDFSQRRNKDFDRSQLPVSNLPERRHALSMVQENSFEGKFIFNSEKVEKGNAYTAWAVGYKVKPNNVDEKDVELTYGCKKGDSLDSPGLVQVDVEMKSHIPILKKEYTIYNQFDLVGALPDRIERFVRLFGLLVKSPGSFLVGCKPGDKGVDDQELCPTGQVKGILDLIADNIPGDGGVVKTIKEVLGYFTNGTLERSAFRTIVDEFVINKLVNSNKYTAAARNISQDIFDSLTQFRTQGVIRFNEQPTPMFVDGKPVVKIPAGGGEQVWQQIQFFWRFKQGCEAAKDPKSCRTMWWDLSALMPSGQKVIKGGLKNGAVLSGSNDLHIEDHELTFNFGALALGVIEKVVLPRYFSAAANGGDAEVSDLDKDGNGEVLIEEVIQGTIADCTAIAKQVDEDTSSGLHQAVKTACDQLVTSLTERLEKTLFDALKIEGSTVVIGSPDGEPCTVHQPDVYPTQGWDFEPLPFIDRLGEQEEGKRCTWTVKFSFADDSVDGTFYTDK